MPGAVLDDLRPLQMQDLLAEGEGQHVEGQGAQQDEGAHPVEGPDADGLNHKAAYGISQDAGNGDHGAV